MSEFIEFGEMTFADSAREEYSEYVCPIDDDKRQKTVAFISDTPESVLQQIEAKALESRAEDRQRSEMSPPLGEGTRERIKELGGFEGNNTTFSWRSAKGVFTREGIPESRFNEMLSTLADYDDPVEGAEAEIARLREADAQRGTRSLSGDGSIGEEDILDDRRAAEQARTVQGEGCDHARGHCENGDPEACEFLQNACGYSEDEAEELLASDAGPESAGATADGGQGAAGFGLDTPGGEGESGEKGTEEGKSALSGQQRGALKKAWNGYQGAVAEIDASLSEYLRPQWDNAQAAARAINAIRADAGQEPIHFERLEELQAEFLDFARKMAADCHECHASHESHDHAVSTGDRESLTEAVVEGVDATPVGASENTREALAEKAREVRNADPDELTPLETVDQQTLGGERADDQARLADGERGEVESEIEQATEENPGGLEADQREETSGDETTQQARPDAFQVPEGGQETL